MRSFGAVVQRALGRSGRLGAGLAPAGRWLLALGIVVSVFVSAFGPPPPVYADPPDPAARLQFIIHGFHINDDEALFGGNDFFWDARLENSDGLPDSIWSSALPFHASTGDNVDVNQLIPQHPSDITGAATIAAGLPVYTGRTYRLFIRLQYTTAVELSDVDLGIVDLPISKDNNWGIGTYTSGSNPGEDDANKFLVNWEIRRTPLPDLMNRGIHAIESADGQFFCVTVQNIGDRPSDSVPLAVRADEALVRAITLGPLAEGQSTDHCVLRTELPSVEHFLSFTVDEQRQIPETDENNNSYKWKIPARLATGTAPVAIASPEPKPTDDSTEPRTDKADLVVKAIRVNGQAPDGRNDCNGGKNAVTVVVKNAGKGDAGGFAVGLAVDGDEVDTAVDSLDAGQEREVRFDGVQMKKGEQTLKAVADAEHTIDESKEENNEMKVAATCKVGS